MLVAGVPASFMVQTRDMYSNLVLTSREGDGFSSAITLAQGGAGVAAPRISLKYYYVSNGQYQVLYTILDVADYGVDVVIKGTPIPGSGKAFAGHPCSLQLHEDHRELASPCPLRCCGGSMGQLPDDRTRRLRQRERYQAAGLPHVQCCGLLRIGHLQWPGSQRRERGVHLFLSPHPNRVCTPCRLCFVASRLCKLVGSTSYGTITVSPAAVANANASMVTGPGTVSGESGVPTTFTITAYDVYGNRRGVGGDPFTASFDGVPLSISRAPLSDVYTVIYMPLFATLYSDPKNPATVLPSTLGQLLVQVFGATVLSAEIPVSPGVVSAPMCAVSSISSLFLVAGMQQSFVVQTKDAEGNLRTVGGDSFVVQLSCFSGQCAAGTNLADVFVSDHLNGTYTIAYFAQRAGLYSVNMYVASSSPVQLTAGNKVPVNFMINVVPAPAVAQTSVATGRGLSQSIANQTASFAVVAKDRFSNFVTQGGGVVEFFLVDPAGSTKSALAVDYSNGTYSGAWSANLAGLYVIEVAYQGVALPLGAAVKEVVVFPGAASPLYSIATCATSALLCEGAGLRTGTNLGSCAQCGLTDSSAGTLASFMIQAKDEWGNLKTDVVTGVPDASLQTALYDGSQSAFYVQIAGVGVVPDPVDNLNPQAVYTSNGLYVVSYNLTKKTTQSASEYYTVSVTLGGQLILMNSKREPSRVNVVESVAMASLSTATGPGVSSPIVAGHYGGFVFTIVARDKVGNQMTNGGVGFNITVDQLLPSGAVSPTTNANLVVTDNFDGTYSVEWWVSKATLYSVTVSLSGQLINRGSPFPVSVIPAKTWAQQTYASPPLTADGKLEAGFNYAFTIHLRDEYGNAITSEPYDPLRPQLGVNNASVSFTDRNGFAVEGAPQAVVVNNMDGTLVVSFVPYVTGTYRCVMKVQEDTGFNAIGGDPAAYLITVKPTVTNPGTSTASLKIGAANSTFVAGERSTFYVQARDRFVNNRDANTDVFVLLSRVPPPPMSTGCRLSGGGGASACLLGSQVTVEATLPARGLYRVIFTPTWAGNYSAHISFNSLQIGGVLAYQFGVLAAAVDPMRTTSTGQGYTWGIAGRVNTFSIRSRDRFDNPRRWVRVPSSA